VLGTELHLPSPRRRLVRRARLTDQLRAGTGAGSRLVLVAAPAGFGKTTLLTQWLADESSPRRVAWLALDPGDGDLGPFLTHLLAAIQSAEPEVGVDALALLEASGNAPTEAVLVSLINDLDVLAGPTVVALDPPLPLSRLRARGELVEVRAADLRFTTAEAQLFLNEVMGLELEPALVSALEARTEGRAAGLQLAALSARSHAGAASSGDVAGFVAAFAGSHRFVLDYLVEEVLDRQPEDVCAFLLNTCVLDQLTGGLCDALTGHADGQLRLQTRERENLFVVALDDERR
jgi:LuxR family maltose regulon positive regulatory protein